jgi:hypothetical protein
MCDYEVISTGLVAIGAVITVAIALATFNTAATQINTPIATATPQPNHQPSPHHCPPPLPPPTTITTTNHWGKPPPLAPINKMDLAALVQVLRADGVLNAARLNENGAADLPPPSAFTACVVIVVVFLHPLALLFVLSLPFLLIILASPSF